MSILIPLVVKIEIVYFSGGNIYLSNLHLLCAMTHEYYSDFGGGGLTVQSIFFYATKSPWFWSQDLKEGKSSAFGVKKV